MLRLGREHVAASLVEWRASNGDTGAIALRDSNSSWWFATDQVLFADRSLATAIADWADSIQGDEPLEIGGPWVPAVWRQVFAERGFEATTDAWAQLWNPLGFAAIVDVPGVETTSDDRSIAARVAVQKAAFVNSTFTVEKWHAMASGPSFRRELDLLARNDAGEPVAAVTAWLAGVGKCGMLEPMGTHPEHRRQGHGRRVVLAACAALGESRGKRCLCCNPRIESLPPLRCTARPGFDGSA